MCVVREKAGRHAVDLVATRQRTRTSKGRMSDNTRICAECGREGATSTVLIARSGSWRESREIGSRPRGPAAVADDSGKQAERSPTAMTKPPDDATMTDHLRPRVNRS